MNRRASSADQTLPGMLTIVFGKVLTGQCLTRKVVRGDFIGLLLR